MSTVSAAAILTPAVAAAAGDPLLADEARALDAGDVGAVAAESWTDADAAGIKLVEAVVVVSLAVGVAGAVGEALAACTAAAAWCGSTGLVPEGATHCR